MKRFILCGVGLLIALATTASGQGVAGAGAAPSIQVLSPQRSVTVRENGVVPIRVKVTGVTLDPSAMGRANVSGRGHFHFYIDCIPADAYTKADLAHCWGAAAGASTTQFDLSTSHVKVSPGTHLLIIALSQNDHVLYKAPPAVLLLTVVRAQPGISVVNPTRTVTVKQNGKLHLNLEIVGVQLSMKDMGRANVVGEAHYHLYLDCVPPDGYRLADLTHCWMGAAATENLTFDLATSRVKATPGTHLLIVALAQNDHVLYRVPAVSLVMIVSP
jgi:hypothetical protein